MIGKEKLEQRRQDSSYYNLICPICGKPFHRKPYTIKNASKRYGITCSRECSRKIRQITMSGENNHQYGLKGSRNASFLVGNLSRRNNTLTEVMVYVGDWYRGAASGRVKEHRYLVEQNHTLFGNEKFDLIDGWYYLKRGYIVHHIDHNHNNNSLSNLSVITKAEHTRLHNLSNPRPRNSKGQFIR